MILEGHSTTMGILRNIFDSASHCIPGIAAGIASVFMPVAIPIVICIGLMLWDMYLGCKVARKNKKKIESWKVWGTVNKLLQASGLVIAGFLLDTYIVPSFSLHLTEIFAGVIAGAELMSIAENLYTIDPTGPWRIFGKIIKSKTEKYLNITIDKEDLPKVRKLVRKVK